MKRLRCENGRFKKVNYKTIENIETIKICSKCKIKAHETEKHSYCNDCTKQIWKESNYKKYLNHPYNGYVYILTNPSWVGWVKIGRATNIDNRLRSYNTSSPYRDYKIVYYKKINNPSIIENYFNDKYGNHNNEWFNISIANAIETIEECREYYNNLIQTL